MKLAITIVSLLLLCGVATANKNRADALFNKGKKLMTEKRYADACEAFEESFKLDRTIGAKLNIAKCYEEWGKIGAAFVAYKQAEKMARDAKDDRADKIKQLIEKLDPEVPRLTIKIPKDAPKDFKVTMDRQPIKVLGEAFPVDPGPKTLEWWLGNGPKKQRVIAIERGGESEVSLDMPKRDDKKKPPATEGDDGDDAPDDATSDAETMITVSTDKPSRPGRNQRIGGIALAGAGVLAIGVSSIMTLSARGKYNDALDMYCGGMKNNCNDMGLAETHDARSTANIATVIFVAGVAAIGGGVALYLLAPDASSGTSETQQAARYLVPTVTPDGAGAGLVFGGRY